jgi:hypothetical protein
MDAHQNHKFGKALFISGMAIVSVFFVWVTFIHKHSSPDHIQQVKDQVVQDQQKTAPPATETTTTEPAK